MSLEETEITTLAPLYYGLLTGCAGEGLHNLIKAVANSLCQTLCLAQFASKLVFFTTCQKPYYMYHAVAMKPSMLIG